MKLYIDIIYKLDTIIGTQGKNKCEINHVFFIFI